MKMEIFLNGQKMGITFNSILTVRKGLPGSHKDIGWEKFTDMVINLISKRKNNIVFLLWGSLLSQKLIN